MGQGVDARAVIGVNEIDPDTSDINQQLIRERRGLWSVLVLQYLGATRLRNNYCFHVRTFRSRDTQSEETLPKHGADSCFRLGRSAGCEGEQGGLFRLLLGHRGQSGAHRFNSAWRNTDGGNSQTSKHDGE